MTEFPVRRLDLNTASVEALLEISGIGQALAEKIVADRPFASVEDLARVQGISPRMAAKWQPLLEVSAETGEAIPDFPGEVMIEASQEELTELAEEAVDAEVVLDEEEVQGTVAEEDELPVLENFPSRVLEVQTGEVEPDPIPEEIEMQPAASEVKTSRPTKTRPYAAKPSGGTQPLQRSEALLFGGLAGLAAVILAVVLALGILGLINSGLSFVSPSELAQVQRQMETLQSQMGILQQDIDGLTTRLSAMEALGGRVTDLESATGKLSSDLADARSKVSSLEQSVQDLGQEMEELNRKVGVFDGFLRGMQGLLNDLLLPVPAAGD
jgi:uncharacterized protein YoxC